MKSMREMKPFSRDQLVLVCEGVISAVFSVIDSHTTPEDLNTDSFRKYRSSGEFDNMCNGAIQSVGTALTHLSSHLADFCLSTGDCIEMVGLDKAVDKFLKVRFNPKKNRGTNGQVDPAFRVVNSRKMAEMFVDEAFKDYFVETGQTPVTTKQLFDFLSYVNEHTFGTSNKSGFHTKRGKGERTLADAYGYAEKAQANFLFEKFGMTRGMITDDLMKLIIQYTDKQPLKDFVLGTNTDDSGNEGCLFMRFERQAEAEWAMGVLNEDPNYVTCWTVGPNLYIDKGEDVWGDVDQLHEFYKIAREPSRPSLPSVAEIKAANGNVES
jgi:hypothetical protein